MYKMIHMYVFKRNYVPVTASSHNTVLLSCSRQIQKGLRQRKICLIFCSPKTGEKAREREGEGGEGGGGRGRGGGEGERAPTSSLRGDL